MGFKNTKLVTFSAEKKPNTLNKKLFLHDMITFMNRREGKKNLGPICLSVYQGKLFVVNNFDAQPDKICYIYVEV